MIANWQADSYSFKSGSLETNSGSPLGAICSTVGVGAFVFGLDGALRFDGFLAARLATFLDGALAFLVAAAFSAFLDFLAFPVANALATGFFAFFALFDFLRFAPAAIAIPPNRLRVTHTPNPFSS